MKRVHVALYADQTSAERLPMISTFHLRPLSALCASLLLFTASACTSDENEGFKSPQEATNGDGIVIDYDGDSFGANIAVMAMANYSSGDGHEFGLIAGWARRDGDFGTVTVTADLHPVGEETITLGTYALSYEDARDRPAVPYATFEIDGRIRPDLPRLLHSRTGEIVVEELRFDDGRVSQIIYTFNGEFSERRNPPRTDQADESDEPYYRVSGRVQFTDK